ncbi:DNA-binding protein [Roseateles toxinivorans]|uniref:DNA-binding protein n=1 Tax=Roseateles toxinivorans TaxID=270368 RepID=UPI00105CE0E6|nr:DNA-binding protein [Roseateles toxinivorans]
MAKFNSSDLTRVRDEFYMRGLSVAAWARDHSFDPNLVYQVLSGRCHAQRGVSHEIALALGLKTQCKQGNLSKEVPTSKEMEM